MAAGFRRECGARHGIAHAFLLKGAILVGSSYPSDHLTINADGILYVDADLMADDFVRSYTQRITPMLTNTTTETFKEMSMRVDEIMSEYDKQAAKKFQPAKFPSGTVATTAAVSHSYVPRSKTESDSGLASRQNKRLERTRHERASLLSN